MCAGSDLGVPVHVELGKIQLLVAGVHIPLEQLVGILEVFDGIRF